MNRTELERLDRDSLISRAEASGVVRARILTRPELIDELLVRNARETDDVQRVRGFFGRARDLLARVIERGLHLPDAAERLRGKSQPPPPLRSTAAPLPTVTLAEIYAAQGHRERAVETLKNVLDREPEHAAARTLLGQLEDAAYDGPKLPRSRRRTRSSPKRSADATRAARAAERSEPDGALAARRRDRSTTWTSASPSRSMGRPSSSTGTSATGRASTSKRRAPAAWSSFACSSSRRRGTAPSRSRATSRCTRSRATRS